MPTTVSGASSPFGLYKVFATVPIIERHGTAYDDVTLRLLVVDRARPIGPYDLLIDGFRDNGCYQACQGAVDEAFTIREAVTVKDYLKSAYDIEARIEAMTVPVPRNAVAYQTLVPGAMHDFISLCDWPNYTLPFRVSGYFDLTSCARRPPDEPPIRAAEEQAA